MTLARNTRSARGDNSSRRLQRIRRPHAIDNTGTSNRSNTGGSARSLAFHGGGGVDDMSAFQYSIDPSQMPPQQNSLHDVCGQTIDDESLYTSKQNTSMELEQEEDWEESRMQWALERKDKMALAGQDNSIPMFITGGAENMYVSTGKINTLESMRSVFSMDATEEESHEGGTMSESYHTQGLGESYQEQVTVKQMSTGTTLPVQEEDTTNHSGEDNDMDDGTIFPDPQPKKPKKNNFAKRFFKSVFTSKDKNNNAGKNRNSKLRQSAPVMTRTPTQLWNSVEVKNDKTVATGPAFGRRNTTDCAGRRSRTASVTTTNKGPGLKRSSTTDSSAHKKAPALQRSSTTDSAHKKAPALQRSTTTDSATCAAARKKFNAPFHRSSTTGSAGRSRGPPTTRMNPGDLWAPEQARARGMDGRAKLRVSKKGVKTWENASGRIIPFNAAEC